MQYSGVRREWETRGCNGGECDQNTSWNNVIQSCQKVKFKKKLDVPFYTSHYLYGLPFFAKEFHFPMEWAPFHLLHHCLPICCQLSTCSRSFPALFHLPQPKCHHWQRPLLPCRAPPCFLDKNFGHLMPAWVRSSHDPQIHFSTTGPPRQLLHLFSTAWLYSRLVSWLCGGGGERQWLLTLASWV